MRRSASGSDSPLHHCAYAGYDKRRGGCRLILTNCIRHGPASRNRAAHPDFRGHLAGPVGHASAPNAAHGAKLHARIARDGCRFGT
nr:hypothetical protein [Burkholderia sp. BCC1998]